MREKLLAIADRLEHRAAEFDKPDEGSQIISTTLGEVASAIRMELRPDDDEVVTENPLEKITPLFITDDDIANFLKHADDNGKLQEIADSSGVPAELLRQVIHENYLSLDPVTRTAIIDVME